MSTHLGPHLNSLDSYSFAFHSLPQWKRILHNEDGILPVDLVEKIEAIIEALEYIEGWEPSDDEMIENNSCGTAWHDGCR